MPEKSQNKTNLQQCIALHITLPQNIPLQNEANAWKIMFLATQIDQTQFDARFL